MLPSPTLVLAARLFVASLVAAAPLLRTSGAAADEVADGVADGAETSRPAATLDDVERQLDEAAARLEALDAEIASGRRLRRELEASVAAAASRVGERRERIAGLDADIARFEAKLVELEGRVAREREDIGARRERLARTLRDASRIGGSSGLRVLLGQDDPALAARLGVYAEHALRAQRRAIDEQSEALARIEAAREQALKDRNWLEYIKRKASGQRDAHDAERLARRERLATVDVELEEKSRSVAELTADRARLETLLEELRALQSSSSGYFAAGKGHYPMPVEGTVEARFGDVKSVGRLRWTGLFVSAPAGAPVRAVADGEIVYADRLRGFGLLVIVDHGDDFMTLYGGNREVVQPAGTWVEGGATIATVGESGGPSTSGVYFEIRENAEPLDPGPWLEGGGGA